MRLLSVILVMNKIFTTITSILLSLSLSSCHKDKKEEPAPSKTKRTVLIYAVAANNLQGDLVSDKNEMIKGAPDVKGLTQDVRVLLYSVASQAATESTLSELTQDAAGKWQFSTLKSYDRNTFSTDPDRIREVITDLREKAPADKYGLIFWSHGTGWIPNFSDHQVPEGQKRSYGMDKYAGITDYCDIHELASAIPDRMFDYIWFDLCYMMGIEVAYQLRDKCDFIAGYPTEDWSMGMNYDATLPLLAAESPDLPGAAKIFYDYYSSRDMAVTVTVAKTEPLHRLADAAKAIYSAGLRPESAVGLQNYSRLKTGLYDFGQFTSKYLYPLNRDVGTLQQTFDEALADVMVYGGCSSKDFWGNLNAFDPECYSGFSCHFPGSASQEMEDYYETLDWAIATRP